MTQDINRSGVNMHRQRSLLGGTAMVAVTAAVVRAGMLDHIALRIHRMLKF